MRRKVIERRPLNYLSSDLILGVHELLLIRFAAAKTVQGFRLQTVNPPDVRVSIP